MMYSQRLKMEELISPSLTTSYYKEQPKQGRAILTLNRLDFKRLHIQVPDHAGIIICTEDPDRLGQAQRIAESVAATGELGGQLIRVYRRG